VELAESLRGTDQWLGVQHENSDELYDIVGICRSVVELGHSGMELLGGALMAVWVTRKGKVTDVFGPETNH